MVAASGSILQASRLSAALQLGLHALIEPRDVDDQPRVRAVADQVLLVVRLDPELQGAAVDRR